MVKKSSGGSTSAGVKVSLTPQNEKSSLAKASSIVTIMSAISQKRVIEFDYHQFHRLAEPHIYGMKNGREQVLAYQIGGDSESNSLPEWRRFNLNEMMDLKMTARGFSGRQVDPSSDHSRWDVIFTIVA
jgi:hypothetical protein